MQEALVDLQEVRGRVKKCGKSIGTEPASNVSGSPTTFTIRGQLEKGSGVGNDFKYM